MDVAVSGGGPWAVEGMKIGTVGRLTRVPEKFPAKVQDPVLRLKGGWAFPASQIIVCEPRDVDGLMFRYLIADEVVTIR